MTTESNAVTAFSASKRSTAVVPFTRTAVWEVLTDPHQVARLTPMVRSIQPRGDLWLWKLAPIEVLGRSVGLSFTERMEFTPQERIVYTHTPTGDERAGVEGTYLLADAGSGTRLSIDLGVDVDLPFPQAGAAGGAGLDARGHRRDGRRLRAQPRPTAQGASGLTASGARRRTASPAAVSAVAGPAAGPASRPADGGRDARAWRDT